MVEWWWLLLGCATWFGAGVVIGRRPWAPDPTLAARSVVRKWRRADAYGKNWTLHILELALGMPTPYTTEELQQAYERDN